MVDITYKKASSAELEKLWQRNISEHPGDNRWRGWKKTATEDNAAGRSLTFIVKDGDTPLGEGTLIFSPSCEAIKNRRQLCDNSSTANINALRIQKTHEGQGHISRLVKEMEKFAVKEGYEYLTIGVEAKETRNLAIYLHWGYTEFVLSEIEDGELVLYYRKKL